MQMVLKFKHGSERNCHYLNSMFTKYSTLLNIPNISPHTVEIHTRTPLPHVVLQVCLPVCVADVRLF